MYRYSGRIGSLETGATKIQAQISLNLLDLQTLLIDAENRLALGSLPE